MGCKCCQHYESLVYLHYFTRQMGKMFQTVKQTHSLRRNIMHVISLAVSRTLGHFAISRRKDITPLIFTYSLIFVKHS